MFTPPPSPQPSGTSGFDISVPTPVLCGEPSTEKTKLETSSWNSHDTKRRAGKRFLWAVILVPFILIAFTVYGGGGFPTSFLRKSAPRVFSSSPSWFGLKNSHQSKWKRGPNSHSIVSSSSSSSSSSLSAPPTSTSTSSGSATSSSSSSTQTLPSVPSSPPVLPTPFPQAFDGILTQNFTTSSCLNFFNNMTASMEFRSCRPFSFLSSTSSTFINVSFSLYIFKPSFF